MFGLHVTAWGLGVLSAGTDTAASGFDPYQFVAAGVTPALVVYLLIFTDRLHTKGEYNEMRRQRDKAEEKLESYSVRVEPLLGQAVRVLDKLAPIISTDVTIRPATREGQG